MLPLPVRCPFDGGKVIVTRFYCPDSALTVEGQFEVNVPFAQLSPDQVQFIETFVRCEGKFNRMEVEMKLSYPTLRGRLHEIIRTLGYEPARDEPPPSAEVDRRQVLEDLEAGKLSFEEAMAMLKGGD